jgi:hypothetical protein
MIALIIWAAPWERPPAYAPAGGDPFRAAAGRWSWSSDTGRCVTAWHDVSFDSARRTMSIHYAAADQGGGAEDRRYQVQESAPDRVMALLEGDETIGEDGAQAVWILILTSDTSYVWRRRDWMPGRVTAPNLRCALPADTISRR